MTNETVSSVIAAEAAANVPMTKEQRIAKIDAAIVKLQAKRQRIIEGKPAKAKTSVVLPAVGDTIDFTYGRAPNVRNLSGVVLGVKNEAGQPVVIRAQVGEGFDAEIVSLFPSQIVVAAAEPAAE